MIEIEREAWRLMVSHAESSYPDECCGAMLGRSGPNGRVVTEAVPMENSWAGPRGSRYEIRPEDLLEADRAAHSRGLELVGIFHSHPDSDAYFSQTDLQNSCPWYSFVVLSVKQGKFHHGNSFIPDLEQTVAEKEEMVWLES